MTITGPTWTTAGDGWRLMLPCYLHGEILDEIHFTAGEIEGRKDGRFNWWRMPNAKYFFANPGWNVTRHEQGVARTLDEAKTEIEKGMEKRS